MWETLLRSWSNNIAHYGPANKAELYEDEKKLEVVRAEKNIHLHLLHRANGVELNGDLVKAVIAEHTRTGIRYRFRASWFADCTGDGCVGFMAGADHEIDGSPDIWADAIFGMQSKRTLPSRFQNAPGRCNWLTSPSLVVHRCDSSHWEVGIGRVDSIMILLKNRSTSGTGISARRMALGRPEEYRPRLPKP